MKTFIAFFLLALLAAGNIKAQQSATAVKIDEVDKDSSTELLVARAAAFLNALAAAEKETRGLITVYKNDDTAVEMLKVFSKDPETAKRIDMFVPGRNYQGGWFHVEFWLIPPGADWPYPQGCGFCDCPSIAVSGPTEYNSSLDWRPVFSVSVSGGSQDTVEYLWTVEGGEVETGQGTPSITVRPSAIANGPIKATIEIKGPDPSCACPTSDSVEIPLGFGFGAADRSLRRHQRHRRPVER